MATRTGRTIRKAAELMKKIATRKGYFDKNPGGGKDARKMKKGGRAGYQYGGGADQTTREKKKFYHKKSEDQRQIDKKVEISNRSKPFWTKEGGIGKPFKAKKMRRKYNIGGRANLLEEMGRIDARRHPDAADRAEKRRVIGELNRGYKSGGAVLKGKKVGCQIK